MFMWGFANVQSVSTVDIQGINIALTAGLRWIMERKEGGDAE